jgi:hypothetical protein
VQNEKAFGAAWLRAYQFNIKISGTVKKNNNICQTLF